MQSNHTLDYSIHSLITYYWAKKLWIAGIPFVFTIFVALWSLTIPNTYLSDAILAPTEESQGGGLANLSGQLGGLASLAGISIGGDSTDNVSIALTILQSRQFLTNFITKYDLKRDIMAAESWDQESEQIVYNTSIYDTNTGEWLREPTNRRPSEPTVLEVYETFINFIQVERDPGTGMVTLSIEYVSPLLARDWLTALISEVNAVMREREIKTTLENITYLEEQVTGLDNLEMRTVFFQLIQEQNKNLMLAKVRSDFVFTVIDPPVFPEKKYAPGRALICIIAMVLSGFLVVAGFTIVFLVVPRTQ